MKTKRIGTAALFLAAAVAFFLFSGALQQESAQQLFEKAMHLEETKGDLEKAIEVYKRIVAEFPEERALAAQALYRSGLCSEKLGRRDAQQSFQKVIEAYPDQTATVKLAREKLAFLARAEAPAGEAAREFKITKIHSDKLRAGYISPDGKILALIDYDVKGLSLRDIATGKEARILSTPIMVVDCWWSPDGQWIAYYDDHGNVSTIPAQGGESKMIVELDPEASKTGDYAYPMGWTSDSKKVTFQSSKGLFAVPASGGKWEEIHRFPDPQKAKERDEWLTLSPDGKFIAYQSTQGGNQDIYVMPAKGGEPVRISDDPANDSWPKWSYDGQWLAFGSTRAGDSGIWVVKINPDGRPGSRPIQVVQGSGGGTWMRDGRIAYSTRTYVEHIFTANTDGSQEVQLTKINKWNAGPRWSPDSKTIAFVSDYGTEMGRSAIWTVPAQGGAEKLLIPGFAPVWSPDGNKIAFCGERRSAKATISIIPAQGGEPRELINYDGVLMFLDWSPDGRHIAFSYSRKKDAKTPIPDSQTDGDDIYIISVADGQVKRLTRVGKWDWGKKDFSCPRWSPDGKKIAFRSLDYERYEKGESDAIGIHTMDIEGGEPKLITNEFDGWWFCWTLDGKHIISSRHEKESSGPWTTDHWLYKIPSEGGKPEKMNIMGRMPDLSPDGRKVVFSRNTAFGREFWLVENFLPK